MAKNLITIALDPAALRRIRSLLEFEAVLSPHLIEAHKESLTDLYYQALGWMQVSFQEPTGQLEDAFEQEVFGPNISELRNPLDYAWRRERGFSGMTDSLGRFYSHDPGIAYMKTAIILGRDEVESNFTDHVQLALMELGAL